MANPDAAFGFRPVNNDLGVFTGQTRRCVFGTLTSAVPAYVGDVVKKDNVTSGITGEQTIIHSAIGDLHYGVVTSFEANPDNLSQQYRPASQQRYCQVALADGNLFEAQDAGTAGIAGIGLNALLATGTGSNYTGVSQQEIGGFTANATADFQVIQGVDRADNDLTLANANWIVKFNLKSSVHAATGT
jgi:acyl CoA:acetate/3-ketoacid CoA transferase alpha subunit